MTVPDIVTALDVSRASQTSSTLMPGEELTPQPMQRAGSSRKTPTFTTRRSHSLKRMKTWEDYGSIDMHGHLDRKQDLQVVVLFLPYHDMDWTTWAIQR